jgi:hypothetical protein
MQPGFGDRVEADPDRELALDEYIYALWIFDLGPEGGDLSCCDCRAFKMKR